MRFKEWLFIEAGGGGVIDGAGQFFYRLSLYPTDAYDGAEAFVDPHDIWALQNRWKIEGKEGRKFHNLDTQEYIDKKFTSIQSVTMPSGSKSWKHSKSDRPNLEVVTAPIYVQGVKKKDSNPAYIMNWKPQNDNYGVPLDRIFKDEVKELGTLPANFDKPWRKVRENITSYDVVQTTPANTNLGVRSKYVGPTETGELTAGEDETPIADFGFQGQERRPNPYLKRRKLQRRDSFRPHHVVAP